MIIDDNYIISYFFINNKINNNKIKHYNNIDNYTNLDILYYLQNRFNDNIENTKISEILNRIKYHIEKRPICKCCGNPVQYNGNINKGLYYNYCSSNCSNNDKDKINKDKNTKLKKYNNPNFNNRDKFHKTCLNKYGILTYTNRDKSNKTCLEKYHVDNISQIPEVRKKKSIILSSKEVLDKIYKSKKVNNTFNSSKYEDETYKLLLNKYPDTIRQYRSELYPFNCDFYIPSLDLYIECNYHWTHGGHPYNPNNLEDQEKLNKWKNKNTKYYKLSINTWTIRDPLKRKISKENKLNYIEFWNIDEVKNWII